MTERLSREEIRKKILDIEKDMEKKGRNYDGLGEAIAELNKANGDNHGGVLAAPKNEVDFQRILKEIRDNAVDEE